jgi:regulator of RNase E activity RraB
MAETWIGFQMDMEDDRMATCLFDIGLLEECPDASRPVCAMVRVPFKSPGENGMGTDEERNAIAEFQETLEGSLPGLAPFARVCGGGNIDLWFYTSEEDADELDAAAASACPGYEVETAYGDDEEWSQYQEMFPTEEDISTYFDHLLIARLEELGDTLATERPVDHAIYVAEEKQAEALATAAARQGMEVSEKSKSDDGTYLVQLTIEHAIDIDTITEMRSRLTELAEEFGGEYDGWQTAPAV